MITGRINQIAPWPRDPAALESVAPGGGVQCVLRLGRARRRVGSLPRAPPGGGAQFAGWVGRRLSVAGARCPRLLRDAPSRDDSHSG